MDPTTILAGFADVLTVTNLLYIVAGVTIGQIVGAMPGLSIIMALSIAIPLTFTLDALTAIAFLISVNKGGTVGGAVPSILLNVPGTSESAATALDGHPMAKNGKPLKAMKYSLYYSFFGDISSDIVLILVSVPLAAVALQMGPVEVCALMVLAFSVICSLVGDSVTKGLLAAAFGMLCAMIGLDPGVATERLTFGSLNLFEGLQITALAIGVLAMSEIAKSIVDAKDDTAAASTITISKDNPEDQKVTLGELLAHRWVALRAFLIGTVSGAIPGLGSTTASFMSYSLNKQMAKDPESFGTGDARGIAATETANSAVVGANLIPLLTLGIPGNIAAALLVSALIIQGVQPGPLLFQEQGQLIYGMFGAMLIANFANLFVGQFGMRFWAFVVSAPRTIIYPGAMILCMTGAYVVGHGIFAVFVMIAAMVAGFLMRAYGFSIVAFIVAYILTPQLEQNLIKARIITRDNALALLNHPVALALLVLSVIVVVLFTWRKRG